MKSIPFWRLLGLVAVTLPLAVAGCDRAPVEGGGSTPTAPAKSDAADVVARVGDAAITRAELEQAAANDLDDLEQRRYQLLSGYLNRLVQEKLWKAEADNRGTTVDQLRKLEVEDKAQPPTSEEVDALLNQEQYKRALDSRLAGAADDAEKQKRTQAFRQQIEGRLTMDRREKRMQAFTEELRSKRPVSIALKPPVTKRVDVPVGDSPVRGSASAPVTIVEYSDFQCPFCSREQGVLEQLRQRYGEKVRIVYKHFPLTSIHPNAQKAAEAAECANEKGKFWELHDLLYQNQTALELDKLPGYAQQVGLDPNEMKQCLDSGRMVARVKKDADSAAAVGVTSTPSFFVNGIKVRGAQPVEYFQGLIDAELGAKG
ncbi:MAG: thioredoxin domain-containing protein [Deltaproteobacteria bacterium]|nr:thioredoxin domain-containing protein [Deltaproteobacteria bacterium]